MTADILPTAARLFCGDVVVAGGPVADLQAPLWPVEAAAIARAVDTRRADFTAGRAAVRRGLRQAGLPEVAILRGANGAPLWPAGIVGSITHSNGFCLAVLSRDAGIIGLGIDIETARRLPDDVAAAICDPAELAAVVADIGTLRVFSAKEAIYKAQYPLTGQLIGFDAVTVRLLPDGFTATWTQPCGPFSQGDVLTGRQTVCNGMVLSGVTFTTR